MRDCSEHSSPPEGQNLEPIQAQAKNRSIWSTLITGDGADCDRGVI